MAYPYNPDLELDNDPDLDEEDLDLEEEEDDDDASSSAPLDDSILAPGRPRDNDDERPLPPAIPAIVLHRLVADQLVRTGFEGAEPDALAELEGAVASCKSRSFSV